MKRLAGWVVVGVGGLLLLAGCDATSDNSDPGAGQPTAAAAPTSAAVPDVATGCPVAAAVLMTALKANASVYGQAAQPSGLLNVSCASRYAVAQTVPTGETQAPWVVFGYAADSRSWQALDAGTSGVCDDHVPSDVAAKLKGC